MNSDYVLNTFAFHYKSLKLPNFSDDSNNMRVYNAQAINKTDLQEFIEKDIIADNMLREDCTIPVEHFSLDFRTQQLQTKIRQLRQNTPILEIEFTDFDFSHYLMKLNEKFPDDIIKQVSIRHMIDTQFELTRIYFYCQLTIYMLFYLTPLLYQIFMDTYNQNQVILSNIICLVTATIFFIFEIIQMKEEGVKEYFNAFFNNIDFFSFFVYLFYFCERMKNQETTLVLQYLDIPLDCLSL